MIPYSVFAVAFSLLYCGDMISYDTIPHDITQITVEGLGPPYLISVYPYLLTFYTVIHLSSLPALRHNKIKNSSEVDWDWDWND